MNRFSELKKPFGIAGTTIRSKALRATTAAINAKKETNVYLNIPECLGTFVNNLWRVRFMLLNLPSIYPLKSKNSL